MQMNDSKEDVSKTVKPKSESKALILTENHIEGVNRW